MSRRRKEFLRRLRVALRVMRGRGVFEQIDQTTAVTVRTKDLHA